MSGNITQTTLGIVYLIQPGELIRTNRFKIGCSCQKGLKRCITGYKQNSRYIHIMECKNPFELESIIKKQFSTKFKKISGNEYFEGNEYDIEDEFISIVINYRKKYRTPDTINSQVSHITSEPLRISSSEPNTATTVNTQIVKAQNVKPLIIKLQCTVPRIVEPQPSNAINSINSVVSFTGIDSDKISNAALKKELKSKNINIGKMILSKQMKEMGAISYKKNGGERGYTRIKINSVSSSIKSNEVPTVNVNAAQPTTNVENEESNNSQLTNTLNSIVQFTGLLNDNVRNPDLVAVLKAKNITIGKLKLSKQLKEMGAVSYNKNSLRGYTKIKIIT